MSNVCTWRQGQQGKPACVSHPDRSAADAARFLNQNSSKAFPKHATAAAWYTLPATSPAPVYCCGRRNTLTHHATVVGVRCSRPAWRQATCCPYSTVHLCAPYHNVCCLMLPGSCKNGPALCSDAAASNHLPVFEKQLHCVSCLTISHTHRVQHQQPLTTPQVPYRATQTAVWNSRCGKGNMP